MDCLCGRSRGFTRTRLQPHACHGGLPCRYGPGICGLPAQGEDCDLPLFPANLFHTLPFCIPPAGSLLLSHSTTPLPPYTFVLIFLACSSFMCYYKLWLVRSRVTVLLAPHHWRHPLAVGFGPLSEARIRLFVQPLYICPHFSLTGQPAPCSAPACPHTYPPRAAGACTAAAP